MGLWVLSNWIWRFLAELLEVSTRKVLWVFSCHQNLSWRSLHRIASVQKADCMSLGNLYLLFRACGATIVNRTDELQESDVGTGAGLFEIKKIGDEYVYKIHALVSYQPYCELFITRASCHSKKLTFLRKHFCIICAIPYSPLEFVCKTDHVVVKP